MEVKLFELRDKSTFVPVMAIKLSSRNEAERYLLSRSGYGKSNFDQQRYVLMAGLQDDKITYDQHNWGLNRTRQVAHDYIISNFDSLESGQVIDVQFILKETDKPKKSERDW